MVNEKKEERYKKKKSERTPANTWNYEKGQNKKKIIRGRLNVTSIMADKMKSLKEVKDIMKSIKEVKI